MHLQLYFRAVSHLSDARFASAAAAEFLGFPWYPSSGDGISQADYIDIRQWISGPVSVLQITARELPLFAFNPTELAKLGQEEQSTICSEKNERNTPAGMMDGLEVPTGMMDFDLNASQSVAVVPDALRSHYQAIPPRQLPFDRIVRSFGNSMPRPGNCRIFFGSTSTTYCSIQVLY